jgi:hypothetical protein
VNGDGQPPPRHYTMGGVIFATTLLIYLPTVLVLWLLIATWSAWPVILGALVGAYAVCAMGAVIRSSR